MKHLLIIIPLLASVLLLPCAAKADWTDDFSGTAMSGIWSQMSTQGNGNFSQNGGTNGVLNFTAAGGWTDWASYNSAFSFGLENDFGARVDYSFDWSPTQGQQAGILMRLSGTGNNGSPGFFGTLSTGYIYGSGYYNGLGYNDYFNMYAEGYNGTGWYGVMYDSGNDILYAGIFAPGETEPFYGTHLDDFSSLVGEGGRIEFSLEGWANYAYVGGGQATFDNFRATAAPEPVSTALFILGGVTLAVRRLRRK